MKWSRRGVDARLLLALLADHLFQLIDQVLCTLLLGGQRTKPAIGSGEDFFIGARCIQHLAKISTVASIEVTHHAQNGHRAVTGVE